MRQNLEPDLVSPVTRRLHIERISVCNQVEGYRCLYGSLI